MKANPAGSLKAYIRETRLILNRFRRRRLDFPGCIAALDAALARLIPRLPREELDALRAVLLANNEIVMTEMERRGREEIKPKVRSARSSG